MEQKRSTIIDYLLSFFFPLYCIECGIRLEKGQRQICPDCFDLIPRYEGVENYYRVWERFEGFLPFTRYESDLLFTPNSTARALIHQIKYHDQPQLGRDLGAIFAKRHFQQGHFADCSIIIPIPLTPSRLKKRGYNQAEYIAQGFADIYKIPLITDILKRRDSTESQTNRKKQSRWEQLENAFYTDDKIDLTHRRVLLIDDVLTTGSTITHAGNLHYKSGIESLSIYTLAVDLPRSAI